MIPVRCFSCGKVIADKWEEFDQKVNKGGADPKAVFKDLGIKRYCCKRMLIGHVDLIDDTINYSRK